MSAEETRMMDLLTLQRERFLRDGPPDADKRRDALDRLEGVVRKHHEGFCEAISSDFGNRSRHETVIGEIFIVIEAIRHARRNLKTWMRPSARPTSKAFLPGKSMVLYQPVGCVGIISPWNYPMQLALSPMVGALAAGNRLMLKPSELTPATSELLASSLGEAFAEEEIAVVTGGPDTGRAFTELPFDHLLFTGSPQVGSLVMRAASEHLVPVTLELGGKSPAIVLEDCSIDRAAGAIAAGKLFNAGQTCIEPDYAMLPKGSTEAFVDATRARVGEMYPSLASNPDYTGIINERHRERIVGLVQDSVSKGARAIEINPAHEDLADTGKIAPTIVLDVTDDMPLMQEEIFGPVLPVFEYRTLDDAIAYVNAHPRPLALYVFGDHGPSIDRVLERTTSGGVTVNETFLHVTQEDLPFGGIGNSGIGAYHGKAGFLTFSHAKGVFFQRRLNTTSLIRPPYGTRFERLMKILIGKLG